MVQDTAVVWWNHVAALHGIALLLSQVVDLVMDLVVELGPRALALAGTAMPLRPSSGTV